ncbi:MAG: hypothetical protein RL748_652 [Pseudomonadota bacterium]
MLTINPRQEKELDQRAYKQLIRQLEVDAAISPASFRTRVLLISCSAYFVLFSILASLAFMLWYGFFWAREHHQVKIMIELGIFALLMLPVFYAVLRMFLMHIPAPQGRVLRRDEAPRLFKLLDKMRRKLRGPAIHTVLIDQQYNAAICQLPRFGLFGGHHNYLILGLPYLLGVSGKEMLATVAHEYGHLCGNHGKIGAWVYRQRKTFHALYEQVNEAAEEDKIQRGLGWLLDYFMPWFNAYTFVLSRQDEYEADKTATQLAGAAANASGLVRGVLLGRWVHEQFWPTLYKQADTLMRPTILPFNAMRTAFRASYAEWATPERLATALMEESDLHDTHPALRDRVDATGETALLPPCVEVTAAEALLGATLSRRLIEEFDQQWWQQERPEWEQRCKYATRSRTRLAQLRSVPLEQTALMDLQEFALLSAEFDSPQAAKPILQHLLKQEGGPYPKAAFIYGKILLDENNHLGLDYLENAARDDASLVHSVAQIGYGWFLQTEDEMAARAWWEKIMPHEDD